jgi:membrane protein YqaA with SNARE-associated domain
MLSQYFTVLSPIDNNAGFSYQTTILHNTWCPSMELLHHLNLEPSLCVLFILSFLAATVVPIGSEWLLAVMILGGFSPTQTVFTATLGNCLGACTTFLIGIYGSDFFIRKLLRMSESDLIKANRIYRKYGSWSLLLSWLPVVGDPLCLVAGIFRTGFTRFSLLVFSGKFLRYTTLAILTAEFSGG